MSVKRYILDENTLMGGVDMFEDDDGDYVLHSDYAALLAHHNELEEALKELLDYTRACEGLLNASESGACVKARSALEEK